MNWKFEAVEKLRQYEAKKQSLKNISEEIKRLESAMRSIRSALADGTPVSGGGSGREDMMLSNIVHREELERSLEQAQKWVALVEAGMEILSQEERLILERFYIKPEKGAADRLAGDLNLDVKTVYKRKDAALRHFTISLYGGVES